MRYLFGPDAIAALLRPEPPGSYLEWLRRTPREDQFTSAVVLGELYAAAHASPEGRRHVEQLERRVLPAVTVLPYDLATARVYGWLRAGLSGSGVRLSEAELQIAATAVHHRLELLTADRRRFEPVPRLRVNRMFAAVHARRAAQAHGAGGAPRRGAS